MYPNPAKGFLKVKTEEKIIKVEIFNYFGKRIIKSNNSTDIDISNLNKGVFLVKIKNDKGDISI